MLAGAGESTLAVPALTFRPGVNGTFSQPTCWTGLATPPAVSTTFDSIAVEPDGKLGFGTPYDSAQNQVEYRCSYAASAGLKQVVGLLM